MEGWKHERKIRNTERGLGTYGLEMRDGLAKGEVKPRKTGQDEDNLTRRR